MAAKPTYRPRWATYLIPIALFVTMAAVVLLLARGYSFDLAQGGLYKTGLIVLDSSPNNAYVTVNGVVQKPRTRTTLKLAPASYDVIVDLPDTHPWQQVVRLDPGEADLEENILLFRDKPERTDLTPAAAPGQALSPSGKELAFVNQAPGGPSLSLSQAPPAKPGTRSLGNLGAGYASPRSFVWSPDGSRVVVSAAGETRIVSSSGDRTVTLPAGGRAEAAPQQADAAIIETTPGQLVHAAAGSPVEPYENGVTAWTVTDNAAYLALSDGTVVKRGSGSDRRVISRGHQLVDLRTTPENQHVFGRTADGTVYQVTDNGLEQITAGADQYAVSRDGDQVVYLRNRELRLWDRAKGRDRLLTRFTNPPEQLGVVPGGDYVLYGRGGELHAIAADGSNDTELAAGVDFSGVINRETELVRDRSTGRTAALVILNR